MIARPISLAHLTTLHVPPAELITRAAAVGYAGCGLRLLPAAAGGIHYPLMHDAAALRATHRALESTGLRIFDLEIVRIGQGFAVEDYDAFFDVGAQLGGKHVLVAGDDENESRLTANFAALCQRAEAFGLTCDIEPMPWTAVRTVGDAHRIVRAAQHINGGVLVDSLHFFRSQSTFAHLHALERARVNYIQVADAHVPTPTTVEALIFDARNARLLPGQGGFALREMLHALPSEVPISVEIPNDARVEQIGVDAWLRATYEATRSLLVAV
jgi:sugar phosphate isomerase/epimerase